MHGGEAPERQEAAPCVDTGDAELHRWYGEDLTEEAWKWRVHQSWKRLSYDSAAFCFFCSLYLST